MSTTRTYKIETTETKEIATTKDLQDAIESLKTMLDEKFSRLASGIKSCDVALIKSTLIVRDSYGIFKNIKQEFNAFGFDCQQSDGIYNISSNAMGLLDLLSSTALAEVVDKNFKTSSALAKQFENTNGIELSQIEKLKNDKHLVAILASLKQGANYSVTDNVVKQGQEYAHDYKNYVKKIGTETTVSRDANIRVSQEAFSKFNSVINSVNAEHKKELTNGITTLITNRAVALGFNVTSTNVDKKQMLKLERRN